MIVIPRGEAMLTDGALVPATNELETIIHALTAERDRVSQAGANQYGPLTLEELNQLIERLEVYKFYRFCAARARAYECPRQAV